MTLSVRNLLRHGVYNAPTNAVTSHSVAGLQLDTSRRTLAGSIHEEAEARALVSGGAIGEHSLQSIRGRRDVYPR